MADERDDKRAWSLIELEFVLGPAPWREPCDCDIDRQRYEAHVGKYRLRAMHGCKHCAGTGYVITEDWALWKNRRLALGILHEVTGMA